MDGVLIAVGVLMILGGLVGLGALWCRLVDDHKAYKARETFIEKETRACHKRIAATAMDCLDITKRIERELRDPQKRDSLNA